MRRWLMRRGFAVVFGSGMAALPAAAVDTKLGEAVAPDWSGYAVVTKATVLVESASADGVTIKVPELERTKNNNNNGNRNRGRGRGRQGPGVKTVMKDHTIPFAPGGMVRWHRLPPKTDEKGNPAPYTAAEQTALHQPQGVPGYLAERTDLHAGQTVELTLVRPKSIPADKVKEGDLQVKYAVIMADSGGPGHNPKKK